MKDLSYGFAWKRLFVKISKNHFLPFLRDFLGWISLYNFKRLIQKGLKIAMMQKIMSIISENKFNENLSLQFFYLVVLSRFLMLYSYFILNCKSLVTLKFNYFGQNFPFFIIFRHPEFTLKQHRFFEFIKNLKNSRINNICTTQDPFFDRNPPHPAG